jgi:hypothetical protein
MYTSLIAGDVWLCEPMRWARLALLLEMCQLMVWITPAYSIVVTS